MIFKSRIPIIVFFCLLFLFRRILWAQNFHSLRGSIGLSYESYKNKSNGKEQKRDRFEKELDLNLGGYIYHPKLATYSGGVDYADTDYDFSSGSDNSSMDTKNISFDLSTLLLPERPVNLNLFMGRNRSDVKTSFNPSYRLTTDYRGFLSNIILKDLPKIELSFTQSDTEDDNPLGRREDRKDNGKLRLSHKIKDTNLFGGYTFIKNKDKIDGSSSDRHTFSFNSSTSKLPFESEFRINAEFSMESREEPSFNRFTSSDEDSYLLDLSLGSRPKQNLNTVLSYSFSRTTNDNDLGASSDSTTHSARAGANYIYSNNLRFRGDIYYLLKDNSASFIERGTSYDEDEKGINWGLDYNKLLKRWLSFGGGYGINLAHKEIDPGDNGNKVGHSANLRLETVGLRYFNTMTTLDLLRLNNSSSLENDRDETRYRIEINSGYFRNTFINTYYEYENIKEWYKEIGGDRGKSESKTIGLTLNRRLWYGGNLSLSSTYRNYKSSGSKYRFTRTIRLPLGPQEAENSAKSLLIEAKLSTILTRFSVFSLLARREEVNYPITPNEYLWRIESDLSYRLRNIYLSLEFDYSEEEQDIRVFRERRGLVTIRRPFGNILYRRRR
jgi:hypothetical protein